MAKPMVVVGRNRERVPFLRGILTRSLQESGLSFEESYRVASAIRDELSGSAEISGEELRDKVRGHLGQLGADYVRRYEVAHGATPTILVRHGSGRATPYSRGQHRTRLEASGISSEDAQRVALEVNEELVESGAESVEHLRVRRITWERLKSDLDDDAAHRYLVWEEFSDSGRPLILMLGGTAGCGKSTVAGSLAHTLEIVRTQSTDMLREVMRMMLPERLVPALHTSSFLAWKELPAKELDAERTDQRVVEGYLAQAELLKVACEAVIHRALSERVSLILDGIHVNPGLLGVLPADTDAVVVPIVLALLDPDELRDRIRGRAKRTPDRRARRYLEHFDSIWALQSHLLSEADRASVPIVVNSDREQAVHRAVSCIQTRLSKTFGGEPGKVFGNA